DDQSALLTWSATGDDLSTGQAAAFELRYSSVGPITTTVQFDHATPVDSLPYPGVNGTEQKATATGLAPLTTYWFAIRALDEVGNPGALAAISPSTTTAAAPPPGGGGKVCGGS